MALWGMADDKTSTGTVQIYANGLVAGVSTLFDAEAKVGDYLIVNSTYAAVFSSITSNTAAQVVAAKHGTAVNAVSSGTNYTLAELPKYVTHAESVDSDGGSGDWTKIYGVDEAEAAANRAEGGTDKVAHAGWVRRIAGTGGRSGRVQYETLVAASSITGDAEDTVFEDAFITITSQPSDTSANTSDSENATFTVAFTVAPSDATVTLAWTYANGDAIQTNANVGNTTQTTLTINSAVENANADFLVTLSSTGADDVVSSNATLTITT